MGQVSDVVNTVIEMLEGEGGLQDNINALAVTDSEPAMNLAEWQYIKQNLPAELAERSTAGRYPAICIYCEKMSNQLREKSRIFSGQASMAIEVRISSDRVEGLSGQAGLLVDAVTATLDQNRGDWGRGVFYGGAYEISYGGIKHGGRNFAQTAKVTFNLEVSRNY